MSRAITTKRIENINQNKNLHNAIRTSEETRDDDDDDDDRENMRHFESVLLIAPLRPFDILARTNELKNVNSSNLSIR